MARVHFTDFIHKKYLSTDTRTIRLSTVLSRVLVPRRARTPHPPHFGRKWSRWSVFLNSCNFTIRPLVALPKASTCCSKYNREVAYVLPVEFGYKWSIYLLPGPPWPNFGRFGRNSYFGGLWWSARRSRTISTRAYERGFLENTKTPENLSNRPLLSFEQFRMV